MNLTTTAQQFAQAFDEAHGGRDAAVCFKQVFFWSDGSWRDAHPVGVSCDAAKLDERQRSQNIVRFYEIKLAIAVEDFNYLRHRLIHAIDVRDDELVELERLAAVVRQRKSELAEQRQKYAPFLPGYRSPEDIRSDHERAERLRDFQQRAANVEV